MTDDNFLIEAVRINPVLYDPFHPKFLEFEHKNEIWKAIGEEAGYTGPKCKQRWNTIRDNYRHILRKRARRTGKALKRKQRNYKYEDQLEFLVPFFQASEALIPKGINTFQGNVIQSIKNVRQRLKPNEVLEDNSEQEASSDVPNEDVSFESVYMKCEVDSPMPDDEDVIYETIESDLDEPQKELYVGKLNSSKLTQKLKPANCKPKKDATTGNLIKYLLDKEQGKNTDAVNAFLASLVPTLRSFTPYYLNLVKTKIFSAVQECEMSMILEENE